MFARLLDAIIAAPDDDAPRRVYADALLEAGDPLGELIHIQLDLHAGGLALGDAIARRKRERELFHEHADRWTASLKGAVNLERCTPTFRRGFIDEVAVDAHWFATRGESVLANAPLLRGIVVERLTEEGTTTALVERWKTVLASPMIDELHGLHCLVARLEDTSSGYEPRYERRSLAPEAVPLFIAAVPRMKRLRALAMFDPEEAYVDAVLATGLFAQLERLDLSTWNAPSATRALDGCGDRLRSLALPSLDPKPLAELLAHPRIAGLDELSLTMVGGGGAPVAAVLDGPAFPKLRRLEITYANRDVMNVIANSSTFAELVELDLGGGNIDLTALGTATRLDALRILRARQRFMTSADVRTIVTWPLTRRLELLDFRLNYGAHTIRDELQTARFYGVLLVSKTWGGWFEPSVYGWNLRAHHT